MSAGLKKILDATVTHLLIRKVHGNPLATYDLVKSKLSDCATHLYGLESAIYMAAGLSDYQVKLNCLHKLDQYKLLKLLTHQYKLLKLLTHSSNFVALKRNYCQMGYGICLSFRIKLYIIEI